MRFIVHCVQRQTRASADARGCVSWCGLFVDAPTEFPSVVGSGCHRWSAQGTSPADRTRPFNVAFWQCGRYLRRASTQAFRRGLRHYLTRGLQDSCFRASLARSLGDTTTGELQSAVICPTGASIASAWIPCSAVHAKVSFGCRAGIAGCAIASWWIGVAVVLLSLPSKTWSVLWKMAP